MLPAHAVLDGLVKLTRAWVPGAHEGAGALVPEPVWTAAVRRLADELLGPSGVPGPQGLDAEQLETRRLLLGMSAEASPPRPWTQQLVCVVGCGRSGTTWLERMLMSAPETGGVDGAESRLFALGHSLWHNLPRMSPLVDRERLVGALRHFYGTVLAESLALHSPGAGIFVEKTPRHSIQLPQISAVFPDVYVVHVVRDGRDVARSMSEIDFFDVPDPADALRIWRRVLREVRAAAPSLAHFQEVRYEQLLLDPVRECGTLLRWIGATVDEEVEAELRRRAGTRVSTHAGLGQPVGSATWHGLSRRALARLYAEGGTVLRREGYATRGQVHRAALHPAYWARLGARLRTSL